MYDSPYLFYRFMYIIAIKIHNLLPLYQFLYTITAFNIRLSKNNMPLLFNFYILQSFMRYRMIISYFKLIFIHKKRKRFLTLSFFKLFHVPSEFHTESLATSSFPISFSLIFRTSQDKSSTY